MFHHVLGVSYLGRIEHYTDQFFAQQPELLRAATAVHGTIDKFLKLQWHTYPGWRFHLVQCQLHRKRDTQQRRDLDLPKFDDFLHGGQGLQCTCPEFPDHLQSERYLRFDVVRLINQYLDDYRAGFRER
jgi:hypothetical protein